jgi:hypothetical protein
MTSPDLICVPSQSKYLAVVTCACTDTCAAVCGVPGSSDCLVAWQGNVPPECTACLLAATGCAAVVDACIGDDGISTSIGTTDTPP